MGVLGPFDQTLGKLDSVLNFSVASRVFGGTGRVVKFILLGKVLELSRVEGRSIICLQGVWYAMVGDVFLQFFL